MMKRQLRIERIHAVLQEYLAANTAAELLKERTRFDPSLVLSDNMKASVKI